MRQLVFACTLLLPAFVCGSLGATQLDPLDLLYSPVDASRLKGDWCRYLEGRARLVQRSYGVLLGEVFVSPRLPDPFRLTVRTRISAKGFPDSRTVPQGTELYVHGLLTLGSSRQALRFIDVSRLSDWDRFLLPLDAGQPERNVERRQWLDARLAEWAQSVFGSENAEREAERAIQGENHCYGSGQTP